MGCEYARRVLGVDVRDLTGGFKCFRASALEAIDYASVRSQGYAFQVELTYRALRARAAGRGGADRLPRARARHLEDVVARSRAEAAWLVPALRFGRRRWEDSVEPGRLPIT